MKISISISSTVTYQIRGAPGIEMAALSGTVTYQIRSAPGIKIAALLRAKNVPFLNVI